MVCSILISQFEYLPDELRLMGLSAVLARFACCWLSFLGMSELSLPPVFDTLASVPDLCYPHYSSGGKYEGDGGWEGGYCTKALV